MERVKVKLRGTFFAFPGFAIAGIAKVCRSCVVMGEMYGLLALLLIIQSCYAIVRLVMLKPSQEVLRGVYTKAVIDFEFVIAIDDGDSAPQNTVICTTEINPSYDLNGDVRQCVASGRFSVQYFHSGTRLTNVTLESHNIEPASGVEGSIVLDSMSILQDVVLKPDFDAAFIRALGSHLPTLSSHDYLFIRPTEQVRNSYSLGSFEYSRVGDGGVAGSRQQDPGSRPLHVALFARQGTSFSASDRFLDWLCDRDTFRRRGMSLSVIAPWQGDDAPHPATICGVPVVHFPCLADDRVNTVPTDDPGLLLTDPSTAALAGYLSRHVGALLVVNTYGDPHTSLLLDIVQALRKAQTQPVAEAATTLWRAPLVIMDLPNIGLPDKWHGRLDGFLAPSRAVALHPQTVQHGLPVAVVFPPMRDMVMQRSVCLGGGQSGIMDPASPLEVVADSLLSVDKFNILFVGRLAMVKAPGLLLRAVARALAEDSHHTIRSGNIQGDHLRSLQQDFARGARVTFLGGGRPELVQALRSLSVDLGLQGMVDLDRGHQSPERVVAFMQQAQLLVNPRTTGETFGFIHLEAAAQGLPVIAFDAGANAESVQAFNANSGDSCAGVQSALLPLREETVVEDLALALLMAFSQFKSAKECAAEGIEAHQWATTKGTSTGAVPDRGQSAVCGAVLPLFEKWNSSLHSAALADAIYLFAQ